jgi:hypothetical protein
MIRANGEIQARLGEGSDQKHISYPEVEKVGQSYITSIAFHTTCHDLFSAACSENSSCSFAAATDQTSLPVAIATLLFRCLGAVERRLRLRQKLLSSGIALFSLTGRILYPIADMFMVHWDELRGEVSSIANNLDLCPEQIKDKIEG